MSEKKSYITFNFKLKSYIYPILLPISCMFVHFFQKIMCQNYIPKESYILLKYNCPLLFYYFFPKIFSFIFILIIKYNTKGEDTKGQNQVSRRYHFIIKNEGFKRILLLIYFISFLEVLYKVADSLILYLQRIEIIHYLIEKRTGFIIMVPLFSYLLLNKKLHKHHIFALILALIGASIINLCRFPLGFSFINEILFHLLLILFSFVFAISLVLIKYLMTKYLIISPYVFLFYDGIFCIVNLFICTLLSYPIVVKLNDYNNDKINVQNENNKYFSNNYLKIFTILIGQNKKFYFSFFGSIISSFCYFIFNILTLYRFSPYLNVLTDFLTPFLYNILNFFFLEDDRSFKNKMRYLFETIGYIIIIFGSLILNEIIIFNFFGLNENTFEKIVYRGSLDFNIEPYNPGEESNTDLLTETEAEISSHKS